MTTLHDCPECALPATVSHRGRYASTHGPVDHVFVRCVTGHWFLGPRDTLTGQAGGHPHRRPPAPPG